LDLFVAIEWSDLHLRTLQGWLVLHFTFESAQLFIPVQVQPATELVAQRKKIFDCVELNYGWLNLCRDNSPLMKNIVILISGAGSNMAAIVRAAQQAQWAQRLNVRVAAVISNKVDATGLAWAQAQGIATAVLSHQGFASREAFDTALMAEIDRFAPNLLVLAGFMRILTPGFVAHYAGRLLNVHPSLLPAFPGLNTHQRAIDAGCQFAGATVHQVTSDLDHGPILAQAVVPVLPSDTADDLAARVLTQEHLIYPRAVAAFFNPLCA
jgi:phosphoribosylglycinamide formyltransferase-1